jgi:hypothetical protein
MNKLLEIPAWVPVRLASALRAVRKSARWLLAVFSSVNSRIVLFILVAQVAVTCSGCGGGGGDTSDGASRPNSNITLQQGEFTVRELQLRKDTKFRIEGCPLDVCSQKVTDFGENSDVIRMAIKYFTTSATPAGTYSITLVSYTGGRSCTLFGGCSTSPEKIQKKWQLQLQVLPGETMFDRNMPYNSAGTPTSVDVIDINQEAA